MLTCYHLRDEIRLVQEHVPGCDFKRITDLEFVELDFRTNGFQSGLECAWVCILELMITVKLLHPNEYIVW
jgi:hypothetical protein